MPRYTEVVPSSSQTVTVSPDSLAASILSLMWSAALVPRGTAATAVTAPTTSVSRRRAARRLPRPAGLAEAWRRAAAREMSSTRGFPGGGRSPSGPPQRGPPWGPEGRPPPGAPPLGAGGGGGAPRPPGGG